jgi:hypothetical protein
MKNNNGIFKKCSEHVVIGYFSTFVFECFIFKQWALCLKIKHEVNLNPPTVLKTEGQQTNMIIKSIFDPHTLLYHEK